MFPAGQMRSGCVSQAWLYDSRCGVEWRPQLRAIGRRVTASRKSERGIPRSGVIGQRRCDGGSCPLCGAIRTRGDAERKHFLEEKLLPSRLEQRFDVEISTNPALTSSFRVFTCGSQLSSSLAPPFDPPLETSRRCGF
ncbi:hypothetical protein LshimejAT787_0409370 [Lyophyllum shimeji]|uniref:Uncharacterized protein n=1 Tax=Lyophyllum shimeji TaxID=47721 RepID=A0A9P3UP31_LYOSH|nr:hypothetical protein LshimejAT787_0409370 [Lyophyllum shimeji]